MKSVLKSWDVLGLVGCWGLSHQGLVGKVVVWRVHHFVDILWIFLYWLVVGVDCKRVRWVRWWLEDEPYCRQVKNNIFGIDWLLG